MMICVEWFSRRRALAKGVDGESEEELERRLLQQKLVLNQARSVKSADGVARDQQWETVVSDKGDRGQEEESTRVIYETVGANWVWLRGHRLWGY